MEDLASGLHIDAAMRSSGKLALVTVNYGTRVSPEVLYLNKSFDFGVVWLDNDGVQIMRAAEKIAKVWTMLSGKEVQIERSMSDPKNHAWDTIRQVIDWHWDESIGQH